MTNKFNIMNNISILDLIRIHVLQPMPGNFQVMFESLDRRKNVVIDEKVLQEFNYQLTERMSKYSVNDPQTKIRIEEFSARLLESLWKNGLVELVDSHDSALDPYRDLRTSWDKPKLD